MPVNPSSENCVPEELKRWKAGKLHSGKNGKPVPATAEGKKQALAIALSSCDPTLFAERLRSMGFSEKASRDTAKMLLEHPDWRKQFLTGETEAVIYPEGKLTRAQGLPDMDIDNRPGRQQGLEGKQKYLRSEGLFPVTIPKGNPQQGPRSRSDLTGLRMFEEACRQPRKPRSPEQIQSTREAQQAAQQQNQTFDSMPQNQVRDLARQGGQAERKPQLPICPSK